MTYQAFKSTDQLEQKWNECFQPTDTAIQASLDQFETGAFECFVLGDVLFALKASPLAQAMSLDFFRQSFFVLHEFFERPGTYEFYLAVFRAIWGEDVVVTFSVPGPGRLNINIAVETLDGFRAMARRIEGGIYVYDPIKTLDGDQLIFLSFRGIKTQDEINRLMRELTPQGVFVETSLTL